MYTHIHCIPRMRKGVRDWNRLKGGIEQLIWQEELLDRHWQTSQVANESAAAFFWCVTDERALENIFPSKD